ncbi:DUF1059 domain-containing protein [Halomarina oriensis]|uniref:DUF1059 domain-containing protein n=1 Tax=Halomarina oriensis TaxID=671145 RepID=A0A6B0GK27_9EURY|nr:DUF1059 domain-containing protein [Halomarina oriensis]MWG34177.1 DUF1059 domain-containing protein [Halomarina oriensis]
MTKHLDCVVDGCAASIEAESEDDVMAQVETHVQQEHPDLDLDDETVEMVRSNIRTV